MIITRSPFRITLGGGGTDLPAYYSRYGGFVFSAGIDKYMFINVNQPIVDDLIRLKYAQTEIVDHRDQLKHASAREILKHMKIEKGIEVNSIADVPAGTGLASSSSYTVALLKALHTLQRDYISLQDLAEEGFAIEAGVLGRPTGKQDLYMASFGGLTVMDIRKDGKVRVRKAKVGNDTIDTLNRNMLIFYTNTSRSADDVLNDQVKSINKQSKKVLESMHYIKELGHQILEAVESDNLTDVGLLFDKHWQYKKKISNKMSNPSFDKIYELAKANGALGGKITGAGGGGFFTFYVEDHHKKLREAMKKNGLREMKYRFDFEGAKVLADI